MTVVVMMVAMGVVMVLVRCGDDGGGEGGACVDKRGYDE